MGFLTVFLLWQVVFAGRFVLLSTRGGAGREHQPVTGQRINARQRRNRRGVVLQT